MFLYSPNALYDDGTVTFGTETYTVKEVLKEIHGIDDAYLNRETFYFILPDSIAIRRVHAALSGGDEEWPGMSYYYGFDVRGDDESQIALAGRLEETFAGFDTDGSGSGGTNIHVTSAARNKADFLSIYGGFFFPACSSTLYYGGGSIMYYKQISEGYDDQKRFEIMQKMGLPTKSNNPQPCSPCSSCRFWLPASISCGLQEITKPLYAESDKRPLFARCTLGTIVVPRSSTAPLIP